MLSNHEQKWVLGIGIYIPIPIPIRNWLVMFEEKKKHTSVRLYNYIRFEVSYGFMKCLCQGRNCPLYLHQLQVGRVRQMKACLPQREYSKPARWAWNSSNRPWCWSWSAVCRSRLQKFYRIDITFLAIAQGCPILIINDNGKYMLPYHSLRRRRSFLAWAVGRFQLKCGRTKHKARGAKVVEIIVLQMSFCSIGNISCPGTVKWAEALY